MDNSEGGKYEEDKEDCDTDDDKKEPLDCTEDEFGDSIEEQQEVGIHCSELTLRRYLHDNAFSHNVIPDSPCKELDLKGSLNS